MKKLSGLLLALLLLFGVAAASVETAQVDFANTFCLMRPVNLKVIELTEDDTSEGMVYAASNDELEMYVWVDTMDGKSAEELYDESRGNEFLTNVTEATVGTLQYLTYELDEEALGAVIACPDGNFYEIMFYGVTDDAIAEAKTILASIAAL